MNVALGVATAANVVCTVIAIRKIRRANFRAAQYDKLMRDWWEKNPTAISQEPTWTCVGSSSVGEHPPFQIPKGSRCGICNLAEEFTGRELV